MAIVVTTSQNMIQIIQNIRIMTKIKLTLLVSYLLSVLPISSQNVNYSQLASCNAIEVKGTLFAIDDNVGEYDAACHVDFHYNLKSQLFPEGGWFISLYCRQLELNEIEQCGRSEVSTKRQAEEFGPKRGKAIEITIGPNDLASLLFVPSKVNTYPVFTIAISGHYYGIKVKQCTFVKVGNHKREKIAIENTKETLSDIMNSWFNVVVNNK